MNSKELHWKNFSLGSELQIAGTFIYNGLLVFDEIETFYREHEVFECLYQLSVGVERLVKIAVILLEHESDMNQEDYENSLRTHTHEELVRRIRKKHKMDLNPNCNKLLSLLGNFYNSMRYARYGIASIDEHREERQAFVAFLSDISKTEIKVGLPYSTPNNEKLKRKLGNLVGKICIDTYAIIKKQAARLRIFTDEIEHYSKAYKIFLQCDYTFEKERILQKELLVFLKHNKDGDWDRLVGTIKPLQFDPALSTDYAKALFRIRHTGDSLDELEQICEDEPQPRTRYKALDLIDQSGWEYRDEEDVNN